MNETKTKTEQFADAEIIVIGNNHGWGRADTLTEARKNAGRPKEYVAYIVARGTAVSEVDGSLEYKTGHMPRVIDFKGVKDVEAMKQRIARLNAAKEEAK